MPERHGRVVYRRGAVYLKVDQKSGGHKMIRIPGPNDHYELRPGVEAPRPWGQKTAREVIEMLKQARLIQAIPASHVAEIMEVAPEIIYRLENTKRDCTLSTALRYARAVGLDFELVEVA